MKACLVLTTVGAAFDAGSLAKALVEQRLAACVNIVAEVRSIYRWNNGVEDEREQLLVIKTSEERVEALREAVLERHPYEVPEFVVLDVEVQGSYGAWLAHSVSG